MSTPHFGQGADWLYADTDSPPDPFTPWHELNQLAQHAGVSVEHLCQTVEQATHLARTSKGAPTSPTYNDDLEEVVRALADDFDLEAKAEWREADHPRDENGRFSNVHISSALERGGTPNPVDTGDTSLPWFSHAQELKQLRQVHSIVAQLYPDLVSRWREELEVTPKSKLNANGSKSWKCKISLAQELMNQPVKKICTQIHESLHALSPTTMQQYERAPNWEEAAIEGALRVHRAEVARRQGTPISDAKFEERDANHPYNVYVNALETMRQALGVGDIRGFYDHLTRTPADQMEGYILSEAAKLSPREQKKFDRRFKIAKAILEDKFRP